MYNDSVETLLWRHYGDDGPTPADLEQRLISSIRQEATAQEQGFVTRVLKHRMSRRRALMLVAVGSGGLGLVVASLEVLDTTLFGRDTTRPALS